MPPPHNLGTPKGTHGQSRTDRQRRQSEDNTGQTRPPHTHTPQVGETYEVHWPHSAAGSCGTEWQYQTPFYDGVFCKDGIVNILTPLNTYKKIGVQGQVSSRHTHTH